MSTQRLRRAWLQTARLLVLFFFVAALLGFMLQAPWATLAVAAGIALAWSYWRLHRVLVRLERRRKIAPNPGQGTWNALEGALHRRQRQDRARARRLLRLLRGYRQAATAMHDGALIVQRTTRRITWFNKAACRMLGLHYPRSLDTDLLDAFDSARVQDWLLAGSVEEPLSDVPSPADPGLRLGLRLLPYSRSEWLVIVRDVTQLTRLEHARRDFVANVSHELRTPLTVVHGYLDLIDPDEHPDWGPMIAEMRRQSQRMTQLVEDLLTLSRLEAQQHLPEEVIEMAPLLATLRREAEALSQGRHAIAVTDTARHDLCGSTRELHSAFSNLVSNAVRYTPPGGRIEIRFGPAADGGAVLAVRDSGFGIPADHIPRITERFYRVDTSRSRDSGGTGLGLSIVKHVLSLHQAHLEIESEVGRGSTFACVFGAERVRHATGDATPPERS